jgi:hypothetical protein
VVAWLVEYVMSRAELGRGAHWVRPYYVARASASSL